MKSARILLIILLIGLALMVLTTSGCVIDGGTATATPGPAVQATLTSAAGEWYAQLTAIAAEKSTP
jgi:hypothetical protein